MKFSPYPSSRPYVQMTTVMSVTHVTHRQSYCTNNDQEFWVFRVFPLITAYQLLPLNIRVSLLSLPNHLSDTGTEGQQIIHPGKLGWLLPFLLLGYQRWLSEFCSRVRASPYAATS